MIAFTPKARRQVTALFSYYEEVERAEAARGLRRSLDDTWQKILADPAAGLPAPRPYPFLARPERAWIKSGRYWITYRTTPPPVIVGVFFETADIPNRL